MVKSDQKENCHQIPTNNHSRDFFKQKKRKIGTVLSKQTIEQISSLTTQLLKQEPLFFAASLIRDDKTNADNINWMQCSNCDAWLHRSCAYPSLSHTTTMDMKGFVYQFCET